MLTFNRTQNLFLFLLIIGSLIPLKSLLAQGDNLVTVNGETKQWHKVTLDLVGPQADEASKSRNPFTDYAFNVTFTHVSGAPEYVVPGYFAADGNAAESSASSGNIWRAHLSPDKSGDWNYQISFLAGKYSAVNGDGMPLAPFHGLEGKFKVSPTDKSGRDLRGKGRLQYVGEHFLKFAGSGEYFLKVGSDAPETLLAYKDFDNTIARLPKKAPLKEWEAHKRDWRSGDPTWQAGKGKGLIGAINYLADQGMNAFSFLTYNAGGDGDNIWPFVDRDDKLRYDCSKLDQWEILFEHGERQGMFLHFKLSEHENSGARKQDNVAMDEGELGVERKLYLRELIARYAHHLALNWNLGEENTQTVQQQIDMAGFIEQFDPYHHLIVTHTPGRWESHQKVYPKMLGKLSALTGASIQTRDVQTTHRYVCHWIEESANAGKPWVVANDEQDLGSYGTPPDPGYEGYQQTEGPTIDDIRKFALWGTLMAGGAGVEYYFGYKHPQDDVKCEDWRSRALTWKYGRIAREFFVSSGHAFWEMQNADELVGNTEHDNSVYCLCDPGEEYWVYFPNASASSSIELDLTEVEGKFQVKWLNPRTGERLLGSIEQVQGGEATSIGKPPGQTAEDWLVTVTLAKEE